MGTLDELLLELPLIKVEEKPSTLLSTSLIINENFQNTTQQRCNFISFLFTFSTNNPKDKTINCKYKQTNTSLHLNLQ